MRNRATPWIATALLLILMPALAQATLVTYNQDFELMIQADPNALSADGWLVYGNVYAPAGLPYLYGYGPEPAPNWDLAFSNLVLLEGGVPQGSVQLSVFSDYENADHGVGNLIESNVFQEQTIDASNLGEVWQFAFEAKLGNLVAPTTAVAFIKTLNPLTGYSLTNFRTVDLTETPATWTGYSIEIAIGPPLVGQILQFGFGNTATGYVGSAVLYDNVGFNRLLTGTPPQNAAVGAKLHQNYPNPFNPETQIDFTLLKPSSVELSVYDLAGRRVRTLLSERLDAGDYSRSWNGRSDDGAALASGRYNYVLETAFGRISRSMVLVK